MQISDFYSESEAGVFFSRRQASQFAKEAADDFNPIHDEDAKLFCVPGDLLFATTLSKFGLSQQMSFKFVNMVVNDFPLKYVEPDAGVIQLQDEKAKTYFEVARQGDVLRDPTLIWAFISSYIRFSGHNFPHLLVPLMSQQGVMLNPKRPLAMYESMSFRLGTFEYDSVHMDLTGSTLECQGRKGQVVMHFNIQDETGVQLGQGEKRMSVRGLQPIDTEQVQKMISGYERHKAEYQPIGN